MPHSTTSPLLAASLKIKMQEESLRLLVANNPKLFALFGLEIGALVLLWDMVNRQHLVLWFVCTQITTCWQLYVPVLYKHLVHTQQLIKLLPWARFFTLYTSLTWVVAYYLFPLTGSHQYFFLLVLLVIAFNGGIYFCSEIVNALLFVLPICIGLMIRHLFWLNTELDLEIIIFIFITTVFSVGIIYESYKSFSAAYLNRLVTEKQAQELQVLNQQLAHFNAEKSRFFSAASHDLRQPLQALTLLHGYLQTIQLPTSAHRTLQHMQAALQSLQTMFDDLLDISHLEQTTYPVQPQQFFLQTIFEKLENEFQLQATAKNLQLRFRLTSAMLYSDPQMIERMLRNLLANAIKYTQHGGILVACRRHYSLHHNQLAWRIQVLDTGIGIAANEQEKIFNDFYQIDNPQRTRKQGVGLGLAITKRLAHNLNTHIQLRSTPGKGSVFSFAILSGNTAKLCDKVSSSHDELADPFSIYPHLAQLTGKHILICDDEENVVQALSTLCQHWGMQVTTLTQPLLPTDLAFPAMQAPDYIISDYQLGGNTTGLQWLHALRDHFQVPLPCLLLTGANPMHPDLQSLPAHCILHSKPASPQQIAEFFHLNSHKTYPPNQSSPTISQKRFYL